MTTRLLLIYPFLSLWITSAFSQDISRREADSLLRELDKSKADLHRADLLLNLAQYHIFKPGEFQVDFDSAIVYINEAKALNKSLKSGDVEGYLLLIESLLKREKGQRDEGRQMTKQAVKILESGTNKFYLAVSYYELAFYYDYRDNLNFPEKLRLVEHSVKVFQQAGTTKRKARALEMLGDLYELDGQHEKALPVLRQALADYNSVGHKQVQGVCVLLGSAHVNLMDYGEGLFYLLKALNTARAFGDTGMQLCNINNRLATLYATIGRYEMAVAYVEDALEIARKYGDDNDVFFLSVLLSVRLNSNSQPERGLQVLASIPRSYKSSLNVEDKEFLDEAYLRNYISLKQYDKGQPFIEPLLEAADGKLLTPRDRGISYRLIAEYYFHTHQYAKARACLTKNLEPAIKAQFPLGIIQGSHLWYKLDSVRGDFRSAFNHLLFYKTKMDSILSENRVRQLQVLGVEYETALKEDSIKLKNKNIQVLTQQNSLQQAKLQQANLIKNVTIAGTVLAFVIIGLLYRLYRQKQKNNKVITQKNEQLQHYLTEKEWLLKEIHHRVKNNLQTVMSLLNSQSAYIDNEPALTAIHDSQHRVHAISLIHQKLYNADNVSSIDISLYIRELVSYLRDAFDTGQRIRFDLNIEKLEMDVSQAVPLGLILNEAITNSIKYAFPGSRDGVIAISLAPSTIPNHFILSISDDGVGMPRNFDTNKKGSLGMSLIAGLSEDLAGSFSIENNSGTTLKITFVHDSGDKHTDTQVESFASVI